MNPYDPVASPNSSDDDSPVPLWAAIASTVFFASLLVAIAMHRLTFDQQSPVLLGYGFTILVTAILTPFLRLRYGFAFLICLPFTLYIFGNFCGDVGRVHFGASMPMAGGAMLMMLLVTLKTCFVSLRMTISRPSAHRAHSPDGG